ncbi:MAG: tol-pal system protein YbgF [Rickettsiaceae bacterium]|nr:tol-pal system protein YbgF [Rickettsiaceae bacterium]
MKKILIFITLASLCKSVCASNIKSKNFDSSFNPKHTHEQIYEISKSLNIILSRQEKLEKVIIELKHRIDSLEANSQKQESTASLKDKHSKKNLSQSNSKEQKNTDKDPSKKQQEKQEYDLALSLLKSNEYAVSAKKFEDFIARYPDSDPIASAIFWHGEAFFRQNLFEKAALEFLNSYKKMPKGPKAQESLLKLATCLVEMKKESEACGIIAKLDSEFSEQTDQLKNKINSLKSRIECKQKK